MLLGDALTVLEWFNSGLKIGTELVLIFKSDNVVTGVVGTLAVELLLKLDSSGAFCDTGFNVFGSIFTIE